MIFPMVVGCWLYCIYAKFFTVFNKQYCNLIFSNSSILFSYIFDEFYNSWINSHLPNSFWSIWLWNQTIESPLELYLFLPQKVCTSFDSKCFIDCFPAIFTSKLNYFQTIFCNIGCIKITTIFKSFHECIVIACFEFWKNIFNLICIYCHLNPFQSPISIATYS